MTAARNTMGDGISARRPTTPSRCRGLRTRQRRYGATAHLGRSMPQRILMKRIASASTVRRHKRCWHGVPACGFRWRWIGRLAGTGMCLEGRIRLICAWRRSRRMPPWGPHERRPVPFMRGGTAAPALRPRHVPTFERERDHRGPRARRDVLSVVPDGLRVLLVGAIAAGRKTRTDFLRRLCLFFVLLGFLARSFEGILRADVPSPGTGTEISGRRNSEQRWLSAAVFQRIRNPRPWHRARRELRRSCAGERYRDADPVLWAGYRMSTRGGGS